VGLLPLRSRSFSLLSRLADKVNKLSPIFLLPFLPCRFSGSSLVMLQDRPSSQIAGGDSLLPLPRLICLYIFPMICLPHLPTIVARTAQIWPPLGLLSPRTRIYPTCLAPHPFVRAAPPPRQVQISDNGFSISVFGLRDLVAAISILCSFTSEGNN
jgi:hypothetical protein